MDSIQLEKQAAFVQMLREGYILSGEEIRVIFGIVNEEAFIEDVKTRTGLDIREGKSNIHKMYFIADYLPLETAGLEEMEICVDDGQEESLDEVEYQDGHYIMWVCPNYLPTKDGAEYCSKFHKVDLGDETLTRPRTVRCTQCGKQYRIRPKSLLGR